LIRKFLRFIYWLLYQPFAWIYDWVAALVSCGSWVDSILATLPYLPGPNVLELGHGPGHLQLALSQVGRNIVGVDISRQMGTIASRRICKAGQGYKLVNGYAQKLGFPQQTFQQVVATYPADYIFDPLTLHEIHRVLAPGGQLVILLTAWLTGKSICHQLTRVFIPFTKPNYTRNLERMLLPFKEAGLTAEYNQVECGTTLLIMILAQPDDNDETR
jgi:ubiquinone/menaquinone biosynthesis C-methylase UbiE